MLSSSLFSSMCKSCVLRAPASRAALEDVAVVEEAVEHGGDGGVSPSSLPQSSTGRFEVKSVLARS